MKRCSECDFTFEDHQQVCDFDGTELTIIPESVPKAVRTSPFRRLARSRVALAALVLAGLISSALLIGYYDSASQSSAEIASNSESRNETANPGPQGSSAISDQAKPDQAAQPKMISTQRRISAATKSSAITSPMLRWTSQNSRLRSSRSRRGPSPAKLAATSTSGIRTSKRRPEKTNRQLLARNQRRTGSPAGQRGGRGVTTSSRQSQARSHVKPAPAASRSRRSGAVAANSPSSQSESSRQAKGSKVVAILRKTGSILTKPFKF